MKKHELFVSEMQKIVRFQYANSEKTQNYRWRSTQDGKSVAAAHGGDEQLRWVRGGADTVQFHYYVLT